MDKISLLKFKIGEVCFGIDPYLVDGMVNIPSQEARAYKLFDLADKLGMPLERKNYRKAILLQSFPTSETGAEHIGILAEEIEAIEDFPLEALKKLPKIVKNAMSSDVIMGLVLWEASICLLVDGEKIA